MLTSKLGCKDIALVAVALLLNGAVVGQLVSGTSLSPVSVAFAQPFPDGEPCNSPTDCDSGFCEQGVCCNRPCEAPNSCVVPGREGTCVSQAESPVMALPFQWMAAGLVTLIAALRIRNRLGR
jgi:hypothetical protein